VCSPSPFSNAFAVLSPTAARSGDRMLGTSRA
jgi:hypothetical protein